MMGAINAAAILFLFLTIAKVDSWTFDVSNLELGGAWLSWKGVHNKSYTSIEEEKLRFGVWLDNKRYIDKHNELGEHSYTLRMNHYGDMTLDEFSEAYSCHFLGDYKNQPTFMKGTMYNSNETTSTVPSSINWRNKKAVTVVKAQGEYRCHSCYAFAAVAALESHHAIATGIKLRLSEQNIIDCSDKYGNDGCQGGNYKSAFSYVISNGGISKQYNYRYKALKGSCRYNSYYIGATMNGVSYIKSGSENDLISAVGLRGPVVVAIDHKHQSFQFYGGGMYSESSCSQDYNQLTHEMVAVGYGTTYAGYDFWTLKNSYGTSWGIRGYMRMVRNVNMCGIATDAGFPLVKA